VAAPKPTPLQERIAHGLPADSDTSLPQRDGPAGLVPERGAVVLRSPWTDPA
jgi:hypothetical protein